LNGDGNTDPAASPAYVDIPEFADFVANKLGTNFRDGTDSAAVVAFNATAYGWNGTSAAVIDNGSGPTFEHLQMGTKAELRARVEALPAPVSLPGATAWGDVAGFSKNAAQSSVMTEGLEAARTLLDTGTGEGIIWLVTDNIYDAALQGSVAPQDADNNRKFYEDLKNTAAYRVIVAYPIVHGHDGAWLKQTSLFLFGIY